MTEVTLAEVLAARDERVRLQKELIETYRCSVVSFTMNIAGPVKDTPAIRRAFRYGLTALLGSLPHESVLFSRSHSSVTGSEAMLAVDLDANALKKICINIEESSRLGRLFDMDVIDSNGKKLDRERERACIVCGKAGRGCAAGRLHSVEELQNVTRCIIAEHFAPIDIELLANMAVESLIKEVETTPKPGLVDRRNNGSHSDMDIHTFIKSANALKPYFCRCVEIGQATSALAPSETFDQLRSAGLLAEKAMYEATGGVNTHKGLIYSMGVILGALGRLWSVDAPIAELPCVLSESARLVKSSVLSDLDRASGSTAGEQLYIERGLKGIRGEVASGFESVLNVSLPAYESAIESGFCENDAGVIALLNLISRIEDTNLYHRGGDSGAEFAKAYAKKMLASPSLSEIEKMDDAFIERNLSPGGCADLLAITYFVYSLKKQTDRL